MIRLNYLLPQPTTFKLTSPFPNSVKRIIFKCTLKIIREKEMINSTIASPKCLWEHGSITALRQKPAIAKAPAILWALKMYYKKCIKSSNYLKNLCFAWPSTLGSAHIYIYLYHNYTHEKWRIAFFRCSAALLRQIPRSDLNENTMGI